MYSFSNHTFWYTDNGMQDEMTTNKDGDFEEFFLIKKVWDM